PAARTRGCTAPRAGMRASIRSSLPFAARFVDRNGGLRLTFVSASLLVSIPSRGALMLSAELVRSVLDSAPDAMIIIDASGSVLFANNQISALFGYSGDAVIGRK